MFKKLKTLFGKGQNSAPVAEGKNIEIPKSKFDFVEQYVITDPNHVMINGYNVWGLCKYTPVAYDNQSGATGWLNAVQLPTDWVQPFLKALKDSDPAVRKDPRQRLISVVHLAGEHKLYIVPSLTKKKGSIIVGENYHDAKRKGDWILHITPEINRAIVEQAKIRSRS